MCHFRPKKIPNHPLCIFTTVFWLMGNRYLVGEELLGQQLTIVVRCSRVHGRVRIWVHGGCHISLVLAGQVHRLVDDCNLKGIKNSSYIRVLRKLTHL